MPSDSETLGFVVLEAMASCVPTVCANAGGLPNLVIDEQTGFLFEPVRFACHSSCFTMHHDASCSIGRHRDWSQGNVGELTRNVKRLLDSEELRKQMGEAGRTETLRCALVSFDGCRQCVRLFYGCKQ